MLKRFTNPSIRFKEDDCELIIDKMRCYNVEKISKNVRDGMVSFHIYGEVTLVDEFLLWLENEYTGVAEVEF